MRTFRRRHALLAGILVVVAFVLLACEGARSIPNRHEQYLFDPFALQTQMLTEEMLTPVPYGTETEVITRTKGIATDENALFRLADTFVRRDESATFRLRSVSFDWTPCAKSLEGVAAVSATYLAEGVDRYPGFPYEFASVYISIQRGYLSLWSSFIQPHDPLVQGTALSAYPPPVPYRRAMQIAMSNGGEEAMQRIGPACELDASLIGDAWLIGWFQREIYRSDFLFVQEIDANTGEVRKVEWREGEK